MTSVAHEHPEPDPHGSHGAAHGSSPDSHGHGHPPAHPAAGHEAPAAHDAHDAHGGGGSHGGHDPHGGHLGRNVGLTMAIMGVLLAFSSALVGGERTKLVSAMIEHTSTSGRYQAVSTKYRVLQSQLQQLHATMPHDDLIAKNDVELKQAEADVAKLEADAKVPPNASLALRALRVQTKLVLDTVAPTRSDLLRLAKLVRQYLKERETAHEWAESYEDSIKIHETAAERYELASLFAEIGIVMASIALLLHSRKAWLGSIFIGLASVTILSLTGTDCHVRLQGAEKKIVEAHESYERSISGSHEEADDERLLRTVTGQEEEAEAEQGHGEHGKPGTPEHGAPQHGGEHH